MRRSMAWAPSPSPTQFSGAYLAEAFKDKKAPVKAALLDQYVVAGLGNIYVCEALFRSGISPKKLAGAIRATSSNCSLSKSAR
jgi:formamidopyrimidine-DNA glycosylase